MGTTEYSGSASLPKKTVKDHWRLLWKHKGVFTQYGFGALLALGSLYQIAISFEPQNVSFVTGLLTIVGISLVFGVWKAVVSYYNDVPEMIAKHRFLKRVFFWQREGWQFVITHHLIKDRVALVQAQHQRLKEDGQYLPVSYIHEDEFKHWISVKTTECARLIEAAGVTSYNRLLRSLSTIESGEDFIKIETSILELFELCDNTISFEQSIRGASTDGSGERFLSHMTGWTDTTIEGIVALNDVIGRIGEGERGDGESPLTFTHTFGTPANVTAFLSQLESEEREEN